jgi:hypothetical protein
MNEQDAGTVRAMRKRRAPREPHRSFMAAAEVVRLRTEVIRTTQEALAAELVRPDNGQPVSKYTLCRWERGHLAVPLWAARRIKALAVVAHQHDLQSGDEED